MPFPAQYLLGSAAVGSHARGLCRQYGPLNQATLQFSLVSKHFSVPTCAGSVLNGALGKLIEQILFEGAAINPERKPCQHSGHRSHWHAGEHGWQA